MLSKRLSTHSISASQKAQAAASAAAVSKPSAIPRPSISQDPLRQHQSTTSTSSSISKKRQRTNSSPFTVVPGATSGGVAGDRASRIPKVSSATVTKGSTSYHPYRPTTLSNSTHTTLNSMSYGSGSLNSRTAANKGGKKEYYEPPSPAFSDNTGGSLSSSRGQKIVMTGKGYIPNEEPPFPNSASTSTEFHYEQTRLMQAPSIHGANSLRGLHPRSITDQSTASGGGGSGAGRMSIDEGNESSDRERPFEHWYRGEANRNGGVGELRIGRKEMMNIAKFGHKTIPTSHSPTKRASPLSFDVVAGRRRAGSMDDKRESWIMDPEAMGMGKVIDESPLTDIEGDEYTTEGERSYPYPNRGLGIDVTGAPPMPDAAGHSRNMSAGYSEEQSYVFVEEDTIMSTTPKALSSVQPGSSQGRQQNGGRQQTIPLGQNNGILSTMTTPSIPGITKPGGKGNASAPANKRQRTQSKPSAGPPTREGDKLDENVEEIEDAERIPYRRPPAKGNWDDIVLPAVSKKMGIEGYGLKSETGNILEISEEERKRLSTIHPPPPIPGLFGYDLSKYRPARPEEDIHMAELGVSHPSPPATPKAKPQSPPPEEVPTIGGRESPLAFSHYQTGLPPISEKEATTSKRKSGAGIPNITISPPSNEGHHRKQQPEKEDHGSGCCGCVIM